jgi:hypothetical protein
MKMYRYPSRDETSQATTPIVKPIHDYASHPSTAFEYFCLNLEEIGYIKQEAPDWASKSGRNLTSKRAISGRSR